MFYLTRQSKRIGLTIDSNKDYQDDFVTNADVSVTMTGHLEDFW